MRKNVVCIMMILFFTAGNLFSQKPQQTKQQTKEQEKQQENKSQDNNKAYFSLEGLKGNVVNFGEIKMGTTKTIQVSFTNTGKKVLVLNEAYTNCGCTSIDLPKEPFPPGKSGIIKITYNPTETGPFNKNVWIYTNAENKSEVIQVEGLVIDK